MKRRKEGDTYNEDIRKIAALQKNPKKWKEYMDSRADIVLDNWPKRGIRKRKNSAASLRS